MPLDDPWIVERVVLAELLGWTFDVLDNLPFSDLISMRAFFNAREKRRAERAER
jgi:hypothetical protein